MEDIYQWIISGICGAGILLLTAIWAETRKNSEKLQEICINNATHNNRIDTMEKLLDKLPCVNQLSCHRGEKE